MLVYFEAPQGRHKYLKHFCLPSKAAEKNNGKLVLFDVTHLSTSGMSDWVIDGGFSDFADALVAEGYTVKEFRGGEKEGPFVAISKPSKGKAAFIGDSSPIEDTTPRYRKEEGGAKDGDKITALPGSYEVKDNASTLIQ